MNAVVVHMSCTRGVAPTAAWLFPKKFGVLMKTFGVAVAFWASGRFRSGPGVTFVPTL